MNAKTPQLLFAVTMAAATHAPAAVHYVNLNNLTPLPPYTSWASAATNIQDAIDSAAEGDELVVTNGIYQTGGRVVPGASLTNRVAVTKPLTVRSVNGPEATWIVGYRLPGQVRTGDSAVRCVYLTNGAALIGFTLTNGAVRRTGDFVHDRSGGGVWCESTSALVSNCVLVGNVAGFPGGRAGGGCYRGTLVHCTLTRNTGYEGGGTDGSVLNNCTLIDNFAAQGGAANNGTLSNCVLTGNSATYGGGTAGGTQQNCTFSGNTATYGGGASEAVLRNCLLVGNSAEYGGATDGGTLINCTLTGNSATFGGGANGSTLKNCIVCAVPQ